MLNSFKQEIKQFNLFFKNYFQEIIVCFLVTFFLVLQWYYPLEPSLAFSRLIYYFIFPVLTIFIILRKNPLDFGLRIGNTKLWSFYILVTIVIGTPILYLSSYFPSLNQYYASGFNLYDFLIKTIPHLFALEYLLRGFLLFGLKNKLKEASILIQMIPFVLLHFNKPGIETLSCIISGTWLGYVAYRSKSFWPAFIIHAFISFTLNYFINY